MRFRKLRIAWSMFWGLACVLLMVLWVRSYYRYDSGTWHNGWGALIDSEGGRLAIATFRSGDLSRPMGTGFYLESDPRESVWWGNSTFCFGVETGDFDLPFYFVPYWLPFSIVALCAAIPWLRWRFSLRTLLIATTLVAVVLGLIAYAAR
jgi:hypothetical protein